MQRRREVWLVRQLVVRRVVRAVVWAAGEGVGGRCCVRGLVMGFSLVAVGRAVRGGARQQGAGAVRAHGDAFSLGA